MEPRILYVIGADRAGSVFVRHQLGAYDGNPDNVSWPSWFKFPGVMLKKVAAAANADGRVAFFGLAENGSVLTAWQLSPGREGWSGFKQLDGVLSSIAVARNPDGRLEIFGSNSAQQIFSSPATDAGRFLSDAVVGLGTDGWTAQSDHSRRIGGWTNRVTRRQQRQSGVPPRANLSWYQHGRRGCSWTVSCTLRVRSTIRRTDYRPGP